jgi:hypothetical protein
MIGKIVLRMCGIALLIATLGPLAAGQEKIVQPGQNIVITTAPQLDDKTALIVEWKTDSPGSTCTPPTGGSVSYETAKPGFTLAVPSDTCSGRYKISAKVRQAPNAPGQGGQAGQGQAGQGQGAPGQGAATTPNPDVVLTPTIVTVQPVVTSIDPKAVYPDGGNTLTFLGPSSLKFDPSDPNYNNYGIAFKDHALIKCAEGQQDQTNCFTLCKESQNGQISFKIGDGCLRGLAGKQTAYLTHNGAMSDGQDVTIIAAGKNAPRNYALGITAGLVLLVYLILSAGRSGLQVKKSSFLLSALFLDEETQSYSLSKCQFYAWTLAAILGYVFLAISKSLIQGSAVFPDIPDGLPGILLASAGTTVLATGITSSKGNKGAGPIGPSLSDFITTGGVVAPERLQFVVWTVVGIATFLTIVFNSDPLTVSTLPKIPDGFLELMGISSAGYLGGKLARKPGPVIKVVSVDTVTEQQPLDGRFLPDGVPQTAVQMPTISLRLQGGGLDPKGAVKVDTQALRGDMFWIKGTPDPQTGFCSDLFVTLNNADAYLTGSHTLTLMNSDSQSADVVFPVDAMTIESIGARDDKTGNAIVTGKNFVDPTTYQWLGTDDKPIPLDPGKNNTAVVASGTSLTVNRPQSANTGYTLQLISKTNLRAEKKI